MIAESNIPRDELIRLAVDNSPATIVITDAQGRIEYVNEKFVELTGYTAAEAIGQSPSLLKSGLTDPAVYADLWRTIKSGWAWNGDLLNRKKNGELYWEAASICPVKDADGRITHYIAVKEDITERKRLDEARQESESRFASMASVINDAIVVADAQGFIVHWNSGAQAMFGYSEAEVLHRPLTILMPPEYRGHHNEWIKRLAQTGQSRLVGKTVELHAIRKDGTPFPIELSLAHWRNGEQMLFGAIIRDITQRQKNEWMESDRRQALEMIASARDLPQIMSHLSQMAERQFPGAVASVLLLQDGQMLHQAPNLPEPFRKSIDCGAVGLTAGICNAAAGRPEAELSGALDEGSVFGQRAATAARCGLGWFHAHLIIDRDEQAMGAIILFQREALELTASDRNVLEQMARLAVIALEQEQLVHQLTHQAFHDPLTGLCNRLMFSQKLQGALGEAEKCGRSVALFYIDVDHFKRINDTLGHGAGDEVVCRLAGRLREALGPHTTLARLGGDEFAVVLPMLEDPSYAVAIAKHLLDVAREPFVVAGQELVITLTVGMSLFPKDGCDPVTLQKNADVALYRAKQRGRARLECFAEDMNAAAMQRLELESDLRRAVANEQLDLYYQPQVDRDEQVIGVEALLRWDHPKLGMVPPDTFVPLAEEAGLIVPLGDWVIREACRQYRRWQVAGLRPMRIAVNVSTPQFVQSDLPRVIADALRSWEVPPAHLTIEITESLLMDNIRDAGTKLAQIRDLGVGVAIDDFGTGHSSLAYLRRLPADVLKIDRSFVRDLAEGRSVDQGDDGRKVVRAIVALAHGLGLRVIAEGVETPWQRDFLREIGCDCMQGFLFGKAQPAGVLAQRLLSATALGAATTRRTA